MDLLAGIFSFDIFSFDIFGFDIFFCNIFPVVKLRQIRKEIDGVASLPPISQPLLPILGQGRGN